MIPTAIEERDKRIFEMRVEEFYKRWAPEDPHERSQFEGALFSIVRQIYTDAQAPLLEQLTKIAMAAPFIGFPK